ncbi:hypothetical protein FA95DRAFT_1501257 [Auriscalpium vulgare]|uniref:Uncharacterized protein n=1 Tax=Auriscalpium vulgare TaxID=40419 RepID=A0ACB8RC93_9AGAM|nr:hypothetical protein FA95DRAFT_1501257 [Auriscalpium vulgare]
MRLARPLITLLSSLAAISSFAVPAAARRSRPLRQHVEPRALLDVCLFLDADALVNSGLLGIPAQILAGLDICLCLSALPLAIQANVNLRLLAAILGDTELLAILTALINDAPGSKHCTYPPHSTPACQKGDPCGFHCDPPYVPKDGQCVCAPPNSLCNGVCGSFPHVSMHIRCILHLPDLWTSLGLWLFHASCQARCEGFGRAIPWHHNSDRRPGNVCER